MRLVNQLLVVVVMIVLCGVCVTALMSAETPFGQVYVKLVARDTDLPLNNVTVRLVRTDGQPVHYRGTTNGHGEFTFPHVAVGAYHLVAYLEAHDMPESRIEVKEGATVDYTYHLPPTAPFLELFDHQRVYTTAEPLRMRCRGFAQVNALSVGLYRIVPAIAVDAWQGDLPEKLGLTGGDIYTANLDAQQYLALVTRNDAAIASSERGAEGIFRKMLDFGRLTPGMYLVSVDGSKSRALAVIAVTDLEMIAKASPKRVLVYAVHIGDGRGAGGVALRVTQQDKLLATGTTGPDGLAELPFTARSEDGAALVVAGTLGDSLAVSSPSLYELSGTDPLRVYTYTDRPVYRPGDTVNFKSIIRQVEGKDYRVPAPLTASVRVVDGQDNLVYTGHASTNDYGSLHGAFTLNANAIPGMYEITLTAAGHKQYTTYFSVAEYRKPEFSVTVSPKQPRYITGQPIEATVSAEYYFGAPVANAKVAYEVTKSPSWGRSGYADWDADLSGKTGRDSEDDYDFGEIVYQGAGTTDDAGRLTVVIPANTYNKAAKTKNIDSPMAQIFSDNDSDWQYTIHATVTDAGKHDEEGSGSALVTQGAYRIDTALDAWINKPGQPVQVSITTADYDGKPLSTSGEAVLERLHWKDKHEEEIVSDRQRWQTNAQGFGAITLRPQQAGDYRLRLTSRDSHGNTIVRTTWLWETAEDASAFNDFPFSDLDVRADKSIYHAGDTAKIVINTSHAPVTALFTLEGDDLLESRLIHLTQKSTVISVPVTQDYVPSVTATVSFMQGKNYYTGDAVIDESRATRALKVAITSDKPTYQPNEKAVYTVKATTPDGKPVQAEVSLGLVDEAIYAIRPDDTEHITAFFYPHRRSSVATAFSFPEEYLSGDNKAGSTIRTRRLFRDTAFWSPTAVTGPDGKATFDVTMPDNLTTWRATCRAATRDTRVGQGLGTTIVQKPFLVRLEAPRFFTQGDRTEIALVAHNLTGKPLSAMLGIDHPAGVKLDNQTQQRLIPAGGAARVTWKIETPQLGFIALRIWGKAGALSDAMELTLPVKAKGFPHEDDIAGSTLANQTLNFAVRDDAITGTPSLTLRFSPTIGSSLLGSLDYLASYPYGCAEQTMSSFLPDIAIARMGLYSSPSLQRQLPDMVQKGLLALYGYQHPDGGWRWWQFDDTDPWMTAYVMYGLKQARDAGFTVNQDVYDNGLHALGNLSTGEKIAPDTRAYIAYVLALTGEKDKAAAAVKMIDKQGKTEPKLTPWGLTVLARTLKLLGRADDGRALVTQLLATYSKKGYAQLGVEQPSEGEEWRSATETAGLLISATCELTPDNPELHNLVQWTFDARHGTHWDSTRDTAFVLYGLSQYMRISGEAASPMNVTVTVNGKSLTRKVDPNDYAYPTVITFGADELPHGPFTVSISKDSPGRLYYSATLDQIVTHHTPADDDADLHLTRTYRVRPAAPDGGNKEHPRASYRFADGDLIEVTLTVNSKRPLNYLMLEDMLPAGCEAMDRGVVDPYDWDYWWCNQIVHDDRVSFSLRSLPKDKPQVITYAITARTPGAFTAMPPRLFDMYNPKTQAMGMVQTVEVR